MNTVCVHVSVCYPHVRPTFLSSVISSLFLPFYIVTKPFLHIFIHTPPTHPCYHIYTCAFLCSLSVINIRCLQTFQVGFIIVYLQMKLLKNYSFYKAKFSILHACSHFIAWPYLRRVWTGVVSISFNC